jgi:hypothetical protein
MSREIQMIPIKSLTTEEGIEELLKSPMLSPYIRYFKASSQGTDLQSHLDVLQRLPLSDRYLWRVVSALKWAFGDFDSESVKLDRLSMPASEYQQILDALRLRPTQLCMLIAALEGKERMREIMMNAISSAAD